MLLLSVLSGAIRRVRARSLPAATFIQQSAAPYKDCFECHVSAPVDAFSSSSMVAVDVTSADAMSSSTTGTGGKAAEAAHAMFVKAFFRSPLFKAERWLLTTFGGLPSISDEEILRLQFYPDGRGDTSSEDTDPPSVVVFRLQQAAPEETMFAWNLFSWARGETWFRSSLEAGAVEGTPTSTHQQLRMQYGSTIKSPPTGDAMLDLLTPLHLLYARLLLASAAEQLRRDVRSGRCASPDGTT